jgi:hypothetical protein
MERKIQATGLGAMFAVLAIWLMGFYMPELMATAPVGLEAALTGGISVLAGWMIPNKKAPE